MKNYWPGKMLCQKSANAFLYHWDQAKILGNAEKRQIKRKPKLLACNRQKTADSACFTIKTKLCAASKKQLTD